MRRVISGVLVGATLLAACREQASPGASASASARAATSSPVSKTAPPSASVAPARTAQIEALIERWRAAQNSGDFVAYEKLYANEFLGIKRVGMQTFRFDRKRWLLDRKAMLVHKPEVSIKGLRVVDLGKTVAARFEQTFASKSFRDVGTKLLVLLEEDGELKIGREEMLSSLVAAAGGVVEFPDFAFVVHQGGRPFALLEKREREPTAPIEYVDLESALSPIVDEQALPSARRGLAGREMVLYGEAGELCRTRVARVATLARAIPHFGQRQQWSGELGDPPAPRPVIARDLVELSASSGSYLALELSPTPSCAKARWARAADQSAPQLLTRRPATATETSVALAAFERLPIHATNQKAFELEAALKQKVPWYRFANARPTLNVFEGSGGKWIAVSAEAGHGCGEFRAEGWALFKDRGGELELESHESFQRAYFVPLAAFDADGDGSPEVLGSDLRLLQIRGGRYEIVLDANAPDFDCGC